jgi:hypothetical protein
VNTRTSYAQKEPSIISMDGRDRWMNRTHGKRLRREWHIDISHIGKSKDRRFSNSLKSRYVISRNDLDHWIEVGYGASDAQDTWQAITTRVEYRRFAHREIQRQEVL